MKILGIIPARMASKRFPGKPMALINNMPMIEHIYHRSKLCQLLDEVVIATCDEEICDFVSRMDGKVVMTSDTHERATDRCAEALLKIEEKQKVTFDVIVMIQGDEPLIVPEMIEMLIYPFLDDQETHITNLMQIIAERNEIENPNNVKVVTDINQYALYFSREPIPSNKKYNQNFVSYRQLGLIAFRRCALLDYLTYSPTPLEIIESIDMNRFIEHSRRIKMVLTKYLSMAVDTPEDLMKVDLLMKSDQLLVKYNSL